MSIVKVTVPDIGNVDNVNVIEIPVSVGDMVKKEQALITLESDKASMEIPSPAAGKVQEIRVKIGDKVKQDDLILILESEDVAAKSAATQQETQPITAPTPVTPSTESAQAVHVPDIGNFDKVDVIEVPIQVGMTIKKNQTLVVLESDKASMEIPAPFEGTIQSIAVKVGDKVGKDALICMVATTDAGIKTPSVSAPKTESPTTPLQTVSTPITATPERTTSSQDAIYASPGVRRLARELNIDLTRIRPTGEKGRLTKEDLNQFIKQQMQSGSGNGLGVEPMPVVDFAQFGPIESRDLSRIKKISAKFLHRNWVMIPHVTQFDEADITDLEAFRKQHKNKAEEKGVKLTPLVFIMKAVVAALKAFPTFNASLSADGGQLIIKRYFHIGVAVDTPQGLVVPVIRDVNLKGFMELAEELKVVSAKAREGQLTPKDMQGSSFSISSLGGMGGTAFTPIINAPDVAILGVSKARMMPVYQGDQFVPRLMLPLSLSYDHRVIDGAEGAQFITYLGEMLSDMRQILL